MAMDECLPYTTLTADSKVFSFDYELAASWR